MLGFRAIGSAPVSGQPGSAHFDPTPGIITLDGVEVANWNDASITDTLGGRSTANVKLIDFEKTLHPSTGAVVTIRWNNQLLFAGTVDTVDEELTERNDSRDIIFVTLKCVDWNQITDRYAVAAAYVGKTLRQILEDIIDVQTNMWEDGVTLGTVQETDPLARVVFNYVKVNNCFRDLAEATGLAWNIDYRKRLNFFDRATFDAPFTIGDPDIGVDQRYRDLRWNRSRARYRNTEILRAGHDLTDEQVESFRGDAASTEPDKRRRTFNLKFEVGTGTGLVIKRNGVEQRVGVRGVDKDDDLEIPDFFQWFYNIGEKEISQNSGDDEDLNPTLIAEDILEVTYVGRVPMIVFEQNDDEIAARKAQEGGSGIYQVVDEDENIDGAELGREKALRLLEIYGRIPGVLDVELDRCELVPGHLLPITIDELNIDAQFMVDTVQIKFLGFIKPRCRYRLLDGERQDGWFDFFRRWTELGKKVLIRDNEVVVKTQRVFETINVADALEDSENDDVTLADYTEDPYTVAWFGTAAVPASSERVCAFVFGRSVFGKPFEL